MSKISIIVPVYNVENYIRRCVDSLLAQTFTDIEILLIDDGSKDCSGSICDEYALKDDRIRVIHKANGGVSSARNAGLDNAIGKYIMFCDPDDYVEPTWCEKLFDAIESSGGFFACCGYNCVGLSGEIKQKKYIQNENLGPAEKLIDLYSTELLQSVWSKIFALTIIKQKNMRFDEAINKAEDVIFVLQYLRTKVCDISSVPEALYNYVFNVPKSLTKRVVPEYWDLNCRLFEEIRKTMKVYGVPFSEYSEIYYTNIIIAILQSLNALFDYNISKKELFLRGEKILNSDECKDAFQNGSITDVHPIYKIILQTRCFTLVWLFHWAVKFKRGMVDKEIYAKR